MSKENINSYYLQCNQWLLNNIPKGLDRILEFGCSGGRLGNTYKEENDNTIWHGIDVHKPALDHASKMIDGAWKQDANNLKPNKTMLKAPYDALVYGDVIEHLIQPESSVPEHLKLLKPGGKVIVCIPNVQHWTVMRHVISGKWEYQDGGLLDRTHLRFFTRRSFRNFISEIDLEFVSMQRISYESTKMWAEKKQARLNVLENLEIFCKATNLPYNELDFRTFQYIFVAQKK